MLLKKLFCIFRTNGSFIHLPFSAAEFAARTLTKIAPTYFCLHSTRTDVFHLGVGVYIFIFQERAILALEIFCYFMVIYSLSHTHLYSSVAFIFFKFYQMNKFVSAKVAAEMFGVSIVTIRNWEVSGKLDAIKTLGGHRRYNLEELKKILANVNQPPQENNENKSHQR